MSKRFGLLGLNIIGIVAALAACAAPASQDDVSSGEDSVTRSGSKPTRFVFDTHLQEGDVTFCLTRHPLDTKVVKFSRCNEDANSASDADTFQVVTTDPLRNGVFSFDGTKQMAVDAEAKTLSFVRPGSCAAPLSCVQGGAAGLTYWDSATRSRRALAAALAGEPTDDDLASGANNARDGHIATAARSNLVVQAVTKAMSQLAQRCAVAGGADSCEASGKVCRLESVDHCKTRCPAAAGPELWSCLDACESPNAPATPYYERLGYCGAKNIQDRCLDGDADVVACSGSQVWAGGFDCKSHAELFRCDAGQTCRSFVSAVSATGERKSNEQLKRELCKAASASPPGSSSSDI